MTTRSADILIMGAGLQGTGVALELARRGIRSTLLDQDACALNRASLRNEGKIHLGFIYANDRSLATAFLQLDGALQFRSILARWVNLRADWLEPSTPFHYLVANDSIVPPDHLAGHYAAVERRFCGQLAQDEKLDYLGERPATIVRPLAASELARHFDPARFSAGFATAERAVDTEALAVGLRQAAAQSPAITFMPSHAVRELAVDSDGFRVGGDGPDGPWRCHARQVVNATWERRLALDRQLGILPPEDLLHRLKFRVIARLPARLLGAPSVSMVLGRYGDVVVRPNGTVYLSWYPAGLRGWSTDIEPPAEWNEACRGELSPELRHEVCAAILAGIGEWYPGMAECEPLLVDAGAIVALGRSDVDDAASALHDRTRVGVTSRGAYHSVDAGKLTTAPLFALEAADRVERIHVAMGSAARP